MKNFSILFFAFCVTLTSFGQISENQPKRDEIRFGIHGGGSYSMISGLHTTLMSDPGFLNYTYDEIPRKGYVLGLFYSYRFNKGTTSTRIGLRHEINLSQQGGDYKMNNYEKDFNYRIEFRYQYVNFNTTVKVHVGNDPENSKFLYGLYLSGGGQIGFSVARHDIVYTSGGTGRLPQFGPDLDQQQQLRNVLKGEPNLGFIGGLGYQFPKLPIVIDAKIFFGRSDVISTEANSYNFRENKNKNTAIQFTIGYCFDLGS